MSDTALETPPKARPFRRLAAEVSVGALLGFGISSVNGPALVSLLYKPLSGDAFNCAGSVTDALVYFVQLQLIAGALGALLTALVMLLVRRALKKRREQAGLANS
jgi:hypothetical protein